jgi:hypothetical protein
MAITPQGALAGSLGKKILGSGAAKGVAGAAGKIGAVGSSIAAKGVAAQSAIVGGTMALGSSALNALKSESIFLMVFGFIHLFFRGTLGNTVIPLLSSIVLFILAGFAVNTKFSEQGATRAGIFYPMAVFFLWYFILGAPKPSTSGNFILLIIVSAIALVGLTLFEGKKIVKGFVPGLIPIFFLILDLSFVYFVNVLQLPLLPSIQMMIQWMPWWALCGWFLLPKESNIWVNLVNIIFILFIVSALVIPVIPQSYSESVLPSAGELEQINADARAKLPQGENPAISNLACIFGSVKASNIANSYDITKCVQDRQRDSMIKNKCKKEFAVDSQEYRACFTEEVELYETNQLATGNVDIKVKEFTKINFVTDNDYYGSDNKIYRNANEKVLPFPAVLEIENPRELTLGVTLSCEFKPSASPDPVEGIISGQDIFSITSKRKGIPVGCAPPSDLELEGRYDVMFHADLSDLETTTTLRRMFVEEYDRDNQKLVNAESDTFADISDGGYKSSAPDELARINFQFGFPETSRVIETSNDVLRLVASAENVGNGKITKIKSYSIDLSKAGFYEQNDVCLSGSDVTLPEVMKSRALVRLAVCQIGMSDEIRSYLADLNSATAIDVQSFEATLVYDYRITKKANIQVFVEDLTQEEINETLN